MKKLKKIAALLLVGVMALALLTACGGGGSGENAQAEAEIMKSIKGSNATLSNDEGMRHVARQNLDADVSGGLFGYVGSHKVHIDHDDNKVTLTVVAKYDYDNTKLQQLITWIAEKAATDPKVDVDVKEASNWSKVGVVVKAVNGHTYVAVSVQVGKLA